jgi:4-amino-4-deoxy-L-arabinose transferase-like glycosyltransferase
MNGRESNRTEQGLLLLWFVLNLVIGAFTVHEYGVSLDEPNNYRYAVATIDAYPSFFGTLYEPKYNSSYDGHGPAYVVIIASLVGLVQKIFPTLYSPDAWHFLYFVTFQLMCLCLYWLARRWFGPWTAWGTLVLFGTQPLLLGHAFMNPKDTPFMFLFTLSVVLGWKFVDQATKGEPSVSSNGFVNGLNTGFRSADTQRRMKFLMYLAMAAAILLIWTVFSSQIDVLVGEIVRFFYSAQPGSWAEQIFGLLASDASNLPLDNYVSKTSRLLERARLGGLFVAVIFFLTYFGLLIHHTSLRLVLKTIWERRNAFKRSLQSAITSMRNDLKVSAIQIWCREFLGALRNPGLIIAGVALGLATAVRPIAPLAGLIVIIYLFVKKVPGKWIISLAYLLVAGIVTYLAWPYLWPSPILKYLESLGLVSNFSHFSGQVLFNGQFYGIRDLPYSYLPVLLTIQFTEPLILAWCVGMIVLGTLLLREQVRADLIIYLSLGFALPLFALILLNSPLYHNFRQVLFVVPPIFVTAAFALDVMFRKVTMQWMRVVLILILALPGLYSSMRLYPYEYMYYNSLVGGTARVQDRFELDYWRTSLREAAVRLNEFAPPQSKIIISGSAALFNLYARPDLFVETVNSSTQELNGGYDYSVQLSRWQKWNIYPDAAIEFLIERNGVVVATIRSVRQASNR